MFYAHFVLAKKGPLARIWLAAHWDKKLTKAHVFETNIEKSVDGILQPKVKMALRTSGHLLLGVVRIYSRKAKYLLADCNEAFVKIKMAFRPGMVDLPDDIREAAVSAITLPEVFHDFDTTMPELNDVDIQAQFTLNQSRAEEITMREDYGNISLVTGDDGFGDMGFEEPPDIMRDASAMDQSLDHPNLIFNPDASEVKEDQDETPIKHQDSRLDQVHANTSALDLEAPIRDDGFGGNLGQDIMAGGLFEGGLFDDTPMVIGEGPSLHERTHFPENEVKDEEDSDDDGGALDQFGGPPSVGPPSSPEGAGGSRPGTPTKLSKPQEEEQQQQQLEFPEEAEDEGFVLERFDPPEEEEEIAPRRSGRATKQKGSLNEENIEGGGKASTSDTPAQADESLAMNDQTTLLHNEEESFALAPVDTSAIKSGWPRTKRKRKLIVDEVKNISGEEMKAQLSDTTDIVTTLDLAPPTKRLMHWKETGGVEKLFALPGRVIHARPLGKLYVRHLTSESVQNEDFGMAGDTELENLSLEQVRDYDEAPETPAAPKPRGRPKRKREDDEEEQQEQEEVVSRETRSRRGAEPETEFAEPPTPAPPTPMHAPDTPAPPTPGPPGTPAPDTPAPGTPAPPTPAHPGLDEAPQPDFFPPPQTPLQEASIADMQPPTPGGATPGAASSVAPGTDYARTPHSTFGDSHDMQNFQTPEHFQTPAHDSGHGAHQTPSHNPTQGAHVHDPTFAEIQKFPDFEPPKIDDEQNGGEGVELQNDENISNNADKGAADTSVGDIPNDADTVEDRNLEHQLEQFDNMGFIENAGGDAPANTSYEESSHPPATTPGALSDGGPKSVYAEAPHSPPPATPAPQTPGPQHADHEEDQGEMPTEEEQAEDETYEEYEERVVNKRAGLMFHQIKKKLRNDTIDFGKMVHGHNRKAVAQKFYTMLVLKKLQAVELDQADPFGELFIRKGTLFENASL